MASNASVGIILNLLAIPGHFDVALQYGPRIGRLGAGAASLPNLIRVLE